MRRRVFLSALPPALFWPRDRAAGAPLAPVPALPEPHFPSRLYQFVWRNWDLANLDRMANVVEARPPDLGRLAQKSGTAPPRALSARPTGAASTSQSSARTGTFSPKISSSTSSAGIRGEGASSGG